MTPWALNHVTATMLGENTMALLKKKNTEPTPPENSSGYSYDNTNVVRAGNYQHKEVAVMEVPQAFRVANMASAVTGVIMITIIVGLMIWVFMFTGIVDGLTGANSDVRHESVPEQPAEMSNDTQNNIPMLETPPAETTPQ